MGKIFAVLIGLVMIVSGVYLAIFVWWEEFYELVFGSIPPILFFVGLIAFIAGISSIKDAKRAKNLDEEALTSTLEEKRGETKEQEKTNPE